MSAESFYRRVLFILGIILFLIIPINGQQQSSRLSDVFLLDLGIVIEPTAGNESYSRLIKSPSNEVAIKIKKVKSGTTDYLSNQKLLVAIEQINSRIISLETSLQNELIALKSENTELKGLLAASIPVIEKPSRPRVSLRVDEPQSFDNLVLVELPVVKSIALVQPDPFIENFDDNIYMTGMYAYQCGNFATALHCFDNLNLQSAEIEKVENILYWTADIYLQIRDYDNALTTLDKLLKYKKSDMIDDALVKKGLMYKKLGSIDLAMNTFKKVVVGHPESEYSRLAALEIKRGEMSFQ